MYKRTSGLDIEKHDDTKLQHQSPAPGRPGVKPYWETGAKTAIGSSVNQQSRIWFTISHGYLNEIYFPDVDRANTRCVRFLVSDDNRFFSDEADGAEYSIEAAGPGIPAYRISSECKQGRYSLEKEILTDPDRDALVMNVRFRPLQSKALRLYIFCNPHMGDEGADNCAWVGEYKGIRMLFAERSGLALAIASQAGFQAMSCGFMGVSDGYKDIRSHGKLTKTYTLAEHGNVAL